MLTRIICICTKGLFFGLLLCPRLFSPLCARLAWAAQFQRSNKNDQIGSSRRSVVRCRGYVPPCSLRTTSNALEGCAHEGYSLVPSAEQNVPRRSLDHQGARVVVSVGTTAARWLPKKAMKSVEYARDVLRLVLRENI